MSRLIAVLCALLVALTAAAQEPAHELAPVEVDGEMLFRVRGVEALPAAQRAREIATRIETLAADRSFQPDALRVEDRGDSAVITGGRVVVMGVLDEDAHIEGVARSLLAPTYVERIGRAITEYREARTRDRLVASSLRAVAAVAIAAILLAVLLWLFRRAETAIQRAFDRRVESLATASSREVRIARLRQRLRAAIGVVRMALVLLIALFLLQYGLAQFPWTRGAARHLFDSVAGPLGGFAQGFVAEIPHLVLLAILFFATRFALSLAALYFDALQDGSVHVRGFEPAWAPLVYNLVRVLTIAVAVVIAYPLIPGSDSDAFKGLSIAAGLMLSFASTSVLANVIAGYTLVFRRAFRIGDRVRIGNREGFVTEMRLQVTHIRTMKNEEVTLPNSVIVVSEVMNFSKPSRDGRLIVHTEVGIGYQAPWRQVEALLIEAARRTKRVLQEPPPYVAQLKLGEFAVTYQLNAYCNRAEELLLVYDELHSNILDQFNEHGVQIMTPAYEQDPDTAKLVAKEQWFAAPAQREGGGGGDTAPAPRPRPSSNDG